MSKKTLDLSKSADAREYISHYEIKGKNPDHVEMVSGRTIHFSAMSDDDAVMVAHLLYDIECETDERVAKRLRKNGRLS